VCNECSFSLILPKLWNLIEYEQHRGPLLYSVFNFYSFVLGHLDELVQPDKKKLAQFFNAFSNIWVVKSETFLFLKAEKNGKGTFQ